ncbi:CBO0543 family protein [Neobacillus vireti]|uniref:CBO0543 family protein n=1 Tax=Neobacillus vireti TaxID=220686 RepID=UPI003B58A7F1
MFSDLISIFRLLLTSFYLLAIWKIGDWKNWKNYYPTLLFYISVNLGICYLIDDFPLWRYRDTLFINNHKIIDFFNTLIAFPALIFLYLSLFPVKSSWSRQVFYMICFMLIEILVEGVFMYGKLIVYSNGWNFWWSALVWIFIFIGVRLHFIKPLWAWVLSFTCTGFLILYFDIQI